MWSKIGLVFCPNQEHRWMQSHAANTFSMIKEQNLIRTYFSCRDVENRSHIGWVEYTLEPSIEIQRISEEPVLSPGEVGYFDENGVSLACIIHHEGQTRLYYLGWTLGKTVPWHNSIGLAIMDSDMNTAERYSLAPIYDRSDVDPISLSYPFLFKNNDEFLIYYGSNRAWGQKNEDMDHVIKVARSQDGIAFEPLNHIALQPTGPDEYAFSRPYVRREGHEWQMWYSFRGASYRIGYAESQDGIHWVRNDAKVGIGVSNTGWDSEMVCYPHIFQHDDRTYMTYNGNRFGKSGFGIAVLVE